MPLIEWNVVMFDIRKNSALVAVIMIMFVFGP